MGSKIQLKARRLSARRRLKVLMARLAVAISCIAVFCVVYMLLAPGLTAEWPLECGKEEHTHSESCWTVQTVTPEPELTCPLEETAGHTHDESCYDPETGALTCQQKEQEAHQHTDGCWNTPQPREEKVLTCGKEEHTHTEGCYVVGETQSPYACGLARHQHGPECYTDGQLYCTIPEHTHDGRCLRGREQSIFPKALPAGYVKAEVFQSMAVFAMDVDEAPHVSGPEALVYVPEDAFDVPVLFVPMPLTEDDPAYQAAARKLAGAKVAYDGMAALDLSFLDQEGTEQEPRTGPVYVKLTLPQTLPEGAALTLYHMTDGGPEPVPADVDYNAGVLTLGFAVDSFSSFTVTWRDNSYQTTNPLNVVYWNGQKEVGTQTITDFVTANRDNGNNLTDGKNGNGQTAEEYIKANRPAGYEIDHYEIEVDGTRTRVANVSYNPNYGGAWYYQLEGGTNWPVWNTTDPTLYVVLKRDSGYDHRAVKVFINKSILTLKSDGTYDGQISTSSDAYTAAINPTITAGGNTLYYTYLNDYETKTVGKYNTVPNVHTDVVSKGDSDSNAAYFITGTDGNKDTSQTSDINTRKLGTEEGFLLTDENGNSQTYKLETFPGDEEVFAWIRANYTNEKNQITVTDPETNQKTTVPAGEITSSNYAIRWLSMKYNVGDYWHLDGVLVKKSGHLVVAKTFSGDKSAINAVKRSTGSNAFYISVAEDKENDAQESDLYRLYLDHVELRQSNGSYTVLKNANGDNIVPTCSDDGLNYTWVLDTANEKYHIMEHNYTYNSSGASTSANISTVTEYRFSNMEEEDRDELHNENWITFISDPGLTLTGRSYAPDIPSEQWQTVHFRNRYLPANALILHTVDADNRSPLPNVEFRITANGQPLTLWYMDDIYYFYRPQGYDGTSSIQMRSTATVNENGELIFGGVGQEGTKGIDYILTEVSRPAGYSNAALQFTIDDSGVIEQNQDQINASTGAEIIKPEGTRNNVYSTTLVHTVEKTGITVSKTWSDGNRHNNDTVVLTLLKNGEATGASLTLRAKDGWTGSFGSGFPVYGPAGKIHYTVSETVNGQPAEAYYAVTVVRTDTMNTNGVTTRIRLAVTNTRSDETRSFRFTKVNEAGSPLAGAEFGLYADLNCQSQVDKLVSDQDGIIQSGLLPVGTYYLKEIKAPSGYLFSNVIYKLTVTRNEFTITSVDANGISLDGGKRLLREVDGEYQIVNKISSTTELPATGGGGTFPLYASGAALMLLALALMFHKRSRIRER